MTLVMMEGFDHFSTAAEAALKDWSFGGTPIYGVTGRVTGKAVSVGNSDGIGKFFPAAYSEVIVGFAFNSDSLPVLLPTLNAGVPTVAAFSLTGGGKIQVKNSGGTVIATGTTTIATGAWYDVEVRIKVNGASGELELQLNGGPEIATTTGNFGTSSIDNISIPAPSATGNVSYDDIRVVTTAGSVNNTFLGDRHVETLYMNADGAHTDWTPDSGTDHFSRINEASVDGDSSYITNANPGDIDTFITNTLSVLTADIRGVQINLWARKDDAALRQIAPVIRQAGTDHVGTTVTLATSYVDYTQIYEKSPASGADWTVSDVNNAEYGVKLIA